MSAGQLGGTLTLLGELEPIAREFRRFSIVNLILPDQSLRRPRGMRPGNAR